MPLTLSRALIPHPQSLLAAPTAGDPLPIGADSDSLKNRANAARAERLESLRCASHHLFEIGASLIRLNFDWMRGVVRDLGSTAAQMGPTPEDWAADWMTFAIRHQVRTSALGRATKSRFSAGRQRDATGRVQPANPARSVGVQ